MKRAWMFLTFALGCSSGDETANQPTVEPQEKVFGGDRPVPLFKAPEGVDPKQPLPLVMILHGFGAMRLPRTVPMSVAMEMLLTGERIDARRAAEVGLVSRVVEPAALLPTAEQIAEKIGQNGPLAIKLTKELAWRGLHASPDDMLRFYAAVTALIHETEDAKEGPRAFSEKRIPRFKNR